MCDTISAKSKNDALELLRAKDVANPEEFLNQVEKSSEAANRLVRIVEGDIANDSTTFTTEFSRFCNVVKGWEEGLASLQRLQRNDDLRESLKRPRSTEMEEDVKTSKQQKTTNIDPVYSMTSKHMTGSNSQSKSAVFWSQFEAFTEPMMAKINNILVIRKQSWGNCYLHAPIVLEHYLIAIATAGNSAEMVDIGKYECSVLDGEQLQDLILRPKGGNSVAVLTDLCGLRGKRDLKQFLISDPDDSEFERDCEKILKYVADKPLIVCNFDIYSSFRQKDKFFYSIEDIGTDTSISTHSILIAC
jgi:hypothetical protein